MKKSFEQRVTEYEASVAALDDGPVSAEALRNAALCRDLVAESITHAKDDLQAALLARLDAADQTLRTKSAKLVDVLPSETFSRFRDLFQPPETAWWWSLDRVAGDRHSPVWSILAGFLVTSSLAFFAIVSARFFDGGPDLAGSAAVVVQGVLTLLAGSAVAGFSRKWLGGLFDRFSIRHNRRDRWILGLALLVFATGLALRLSLPAIAMVYNCWGRRQQTKGQFSDAIASFRRAIALNPDFTQAQYNLATCYEDIEDYEKAIAAYQTSINGDAEMLQAYNNLGRLMIVHKKDYAAALRLLSRAETLNPQDMQSRFSIAKNKGWANLALQNYDEAEFDLSSALRIDSSRASPHCLLAQVYEAKKNAAGSLAEWRLCTKSRVEDDVEQDWLEKASERLAALTD